MNEPSYWVGQSGRQYTYYASCLLADIGNTPWLTDAGNYIFAKVNDTTQRWEAVYMGEADSLRKRLTPAHEKLPCARQYQATHILTHVNSGTYQQRLDEETDLRNVNRPPCNLQ